MYEEHDMLRLRWWETRLEIHGLRTDNEALREELDEMEDLVIENYEREDDLRVELQAALGRIEELEEQRSRPSVGVSDNADNTVGRQASSPHKVPGASPRLGQWPPEDYAVQFRQMMEESNDL